MDETQWREYYRFVRLDDKRKKEMVERCGGVKDIVNPLTQKKHQETIDEAAVRIKKEIIATEPMVQPDTGVL